MVSKNHVLGSRIISGIFLRPRSKSAYRSGMEKHGTNLFIPEKRTSGIRGQKRENLRSVGSFGEEIARKHLERSGFRIVESNWTARAAEIDLIARDDEGKLWFFEVKFRRGGGFGSAAESFTTKKRNDFFRAVSLYCAKNGIDFDTTRSGLVAIDETDFGYRVSRYPNLSPEGE